MDNNFNYTIILLYCILFHYKSQCVIISLMEWVFNCFFLLIFEKTSSSSSIIGNDFFKLGLNLQSHVVLDASGVPKADVWMNTSIYRRDARVQTFSEEEGLKMKEEYALKPGQEEFNSLITRYTMTV